MANITPQRKMKVFTIYKT